MSVYRHIHTDADGRAARARLKPGTDTASDCSEATVRDLWTDAVKPYLNPRPSGAPAWEAAEPA